MADENRKNNRNDLFKRLTQLFRGGPNVKKKVRAFRAPAASTAVEVFKKSYSQVYSNALNAYGQYDRMSRYADFCFAGDTLVYTTKGAKTLKELASICSDGTRINVYAYDLSTKTVKIAEAHSARLAREGVEQDLLRVTFDDGGHVDVTPDHSFLLKGGEYIKACDLKPDMSLQPFYRRDITGDGYRWIYTNDRERSKGGWITEHLMVMEHFLGRRLTDDEVVHHKDFQRSNNLLENLELMSQDAHAKFHAQLNNVNKFGKPAQKHSAWMIVNNHSKRKDITFEVVVKTAIECKFVKKNVIAFLNADQNVINRRIRERGFKNWREFQSKQNEIQKFLTHSSIVQETRSPSIQEILEVSSKFNSLYEISCALRCTTNAISRRLHAHGYGSWTEFKTGNKQQNKKGPKPDKGLYQKICNAYHKGMTQQELGDAVGSTKNKVLTSIINEGFKCYSEWVKTFENHKVKSIETISGKQQVFNITVEGFHNLAVGSINPNNSNVREYSMVFAKQSEMEYTPEIASALDIYAEESTSVDDKSVVLHVYSDNTKIHEILNSLLHDVLNVEHNLTPWTRNLVKFGDFFLFIDINPDMGVVNVFPMPINEVERDEGWDPSNPLAVRFRWASQGNQVLESWQVAHFRLMGNDAFLPYGSSILESARRIWRQLILIEDAMLVYRVVRSPERRVFYIDVGSVPNEDISNYMEAAQSKLKRSPVIDKQTGRIDLRYNPLCHFPNDFIYLCNGTREKIIDVVENWDQFKGASVWSLDKNCNVVPSKLIWAGKTKDSATFVQVTLDDGQTISTTPEHKWLLRDGKEIEASELTVGMSLMPFYQRKAESLTRKYAHKAESNYYVDLFHPGKNKWASAHQIVARSVYGDHSWPMIVHHKNHLKHDNSPENLEWMTQKDHSKLHSDIIIAYNKSPEGRKKSKETLKKTWEKEGFKDVVVQLWENEEIRNKRVNSLTFRVDSRFIQHVLRSIEALGTSAREYTIRNWLNNDPEFTSYLRELNPGFRNGFIDSMSKGGFLRHLRSQNVKNVRAAKDLWASIRAPWDAIVDFCEEKKPIKRVEILRYFKIGRYDLTRIINQHGLTAQQFDKKYLSGGHYGIIKSVSCEGCGVSFEVSGRSSGQHYHDRDCYFKHMGRQKLKAASGLNHTIVAIKIVEDYGPAYGLTVENSTHTIAIGGELHGSNSKLQGVKLDENRQAIDLIGGIFIKNSVDEDYFIPIRGSESGTKIDTLAGGQHVSDIADVEYIQKKLFAAIKVPRAYLGYDESLSCFTPETLVSLLDGRDISIQQMHDELHSGKELWVYSIDRETQQIVPGRVTHAQPTRADAELVRVTLDTNETIDCTPDHKFMLRDGSWCEAGKLLPGSSLMPLYRKRVSLNGGPEYEQVLDPHDEKWRFTHRVVAERVDGGIPSDQSCLDEDRITIHHVNVDRFNNVPNNLLRIGWSAHRKLHQDMLEEIKRKALAEGKYHGENNGWAKKTQRDVKSLWDIEKLKAWCKENNPRNKREVYAGYGLSENKLFKLLKENNVTYAEFAKKHVDGGYKLAVKGAGGYSFKQRTQRQVGGTWIDSRCVTCSKQFKHLVNKTRLNCSDCLAASKTGSIKLRRKPMTNHKVISVVKLDERRQTWCISVEKYENFALAKGNFVSNSKATLAQEDIRFSRSISRIQRVLISELEKICIIHLFAHGYEGEDLTDFTLQLSNPSTVAQMQKLELWRTKFEIAGTVPEGLTDRDFIRKEIFQLTDDRIEKIKEGRKVDRIEDLELEASELEGNEPGGGGGGAPGGLGGLPGGGGLSSSMGGMDDMAGGGEPPAGEAPESADGGGGAGDAEPAGGEEGEGEDLFAGAEDESEGGALLATEQDSDVSKLPKNSLTRSIMDIRKKEHPGTPGARKSPANSTPLSKYLYNRGRIKTHGATKTHMPDFQGVLELDNDAYDKRFFRAGPFGESTELSSALLVDEIFSTKTKKKLSAEMKIMLSSLRKRIGNKVVAEPTSKVLTEDVAPEADIDVIIEDDGKEKDVLDGIIDVPLNLNESES